MTKSENSDLIGTSQSTSQSVEVFDENSVNQVCLSFVDFGAVLH